MTTFSSEDVDRPEDTQNPTQVESPEAIEDARRLVIAQDEVDWSQYKEIEGLEHLGRAIVDSNGIPSGSPANYEKLRGTTGRADLPNAADIITALQEEFGKPSA